MLPVMIIALMFESYKAINGSEYWAEVWLAFDQLYNAWFEGWQKETISSRLGKSIYHGHELVFFRHGRYDKIVSWALSQVDPDHCRKSIDWGVGDG